VNFLGEIQAKEKEMKDAKKIIAELKKRSEKTSDKEESNSLLKEAKNMVEQYNKFKIQK
jgi:TolA-binding protein